MIVYAFRHLTTLLLINIILVLGDAMEMHHKPKKITTTQKQSTSNKVPSTEKGEVTHHTLNNYEPDKSHIQLN